MPLTLLQSVALLAGSLSSAGMVLAQFPGQQMQLMPQQQQGQQAWPGMQQQQQTRQPAGWGMMPQQQQQQPGGWGMMPQQQQQQPGGMMMSPSMGMRPQATGGTGGFFPQQQQAMMPGMMQGAGGFLPGQAAFPSSNNMRAPLAPNPPMGAVPGAMGGMGAGFGAGSMTGAGAGFGSSPMAGAGLGAGASSTPNTGLPPGQLPPVSSSGVPGATSGESCMECAVVDTGITTCTVGMNSTIPASEFPLIANCFCPAYLATDITSCSTCLTRNAMQAKADMLQTLMTGCTSSNWEEVGRTIAVTMGASVGPSSTTTPGAGSGASTAAPGSASTGGVISVNNVTGNGTDPTTTTTVKGNGAGRTIPTAALSALALLPLLLVVGLSGL